MSQIFPPIIDLYAKLFELGMLLSVGGTYSFICSIDFHIETTLESPCSNRSPSTINIT